MSRPLKCLLFAFFSVSLLFPLIRMFLNIGPGDVSRVLASPQFLRALGNSALASALGTAVSILAAWVFAVCVVRSAMPFPGIFSVFATVPMLIPSISHGMGLIIILGANGILTRALGLRTSIYGLPGVAAGGVLYAFPVAFLMLADILKYEDYGPYEAAAALGIPRVRQFLGITLPYLRRPLISVVFAVFTLIFTDYGVPLMIGGRFTTLPVLMYQEVIGLLNFSRGSVIGAVLLFPAVIAFVFDLLSRDRGSALFIAQEKHRGARKFRDGAAFVYCAGVCLILALPLVMFVVLTFIAKYPVNMTFSLVNIKRTLALGAARHFGTSVIVAVFVSVIGVFVSYVTAYVTARLPGHLSRPLHLVSITSLAVPGLVLGLSYALFFKGTVIYGTLAILVLVNILHFCASPYLMAYNSLGKLNPNLEAVGLTLGVKRLRVVFDVLVPQTRSTILEMAAYFFINSMMTISAVSFLSTTRFKPVSLMITQFEATMQLESAAFVSLMILGSNFLVKVAVYFLKQTGSRRNHGH